MRDKIDPFFLRIIDEKQRQDSITKSTNSTLRKKKKAKTVKTKVAEEKYDCIVYTKNTKVIMNSGITINSVLPGFVTASATIRQIIKLSAMPAVTYIEAPTHNKLHK
jgi:hypothetical protein